MLILLSATDFIVCRPQQRTCKKCEKVENRRKRRHIDKHYVHVFLAILTRSVHSYSSCFYRIDSEMIYDIKFVNVL